MRKIGHLILLILLLSAPGALAQGAQLIVEHDWSFQIAGGRYGLVQWHWEGRYTNVFVGRRLFSVKMRAVPLLALLFVPVAAAGVFMSRFRDTKN